MGVWVCVLGCTSANVSIILSPSVVLPPGACAYLGHIGCCILHIEQPIAGVEELHVLCFEQVPWCFKGRGPVLAPCRVENGSFSGFFLGSHKAHLCGGRWLLLMHTAVVCG